MSLGCRTTANNRFLLEMAKKVPLDRLRQISKRRRPDALARFAQHGPAQGTPEHQPEKESAGE